MTDVLTEVAPPPPGPTRAERAWPWEALAIILAGFVLRALGFLSDRSLWLDEAYLALNIMERDFAGLLRPLRHGQTAPVGFLLLEEAATRLLGSGERALRLVPFVAGVASLPLFWQLARRCLRPREAVFALGLFAILYPLVYYSSEVKQYSLDVAVALAILLSALAVLREDRFRPGRYVALALVGALAVWLSHPAVFVLAGVGAVLLVSPGDASRRRWLAAAGLLWGVCFVANYFLFLRGIKAEGDLHLFWQNRFLRWPTSPGAIRQDLELLLQPFTRVLGFGESGLAALAFAVGLVSLYGRDRRLFWLLIAPFFPALLASLLRLYPFASRPILFTAPLFLVMIAAGVGHVLRLPGRGARLLGWVFVGLLLLKPAETAARTYARPPGREEMRQVLEYLAPRVRPGDVVWVNDRGQYAFRYYVHHRGGYGRIASLGPVIGQGTDGPHKARRIREEIALLAGKPRVWFVLAPVARSDDGANGRALALVLLDGAGRRLDEREAVGASAYLYDLSRPPVSAEGRAAPR